MKSLNSFCLIICTYGLWFIFIINAGRASGKGTTLKPATSVLGQAIKSCGFNLSDLGNIIMGLNDALDFYQDHIPDLVLDAATGTRILEAQLNLMLKNPNINITRQLRRALYLLYTKSQVISEQIILSVQENEELSETAKNNTLPWVKSASLWQTPILGNWETLENGMTFKKSDSKPSKSAEALNESISDSCIGDLLRGCKLSTSCASAFLEEPHSRYSLTHQIIFILFAEKKSCLAKSTRFRTKFEATISNSLSLSQYKHKLCEKVWVEANSIAEKGFPHDSQDLLAEQIAICSLAGYKNFLQYDWLAAILSWQNNDYESSSVGCFGIVNEVKSKGNRRKRSDSLIAYEQNDDKECSVHFTAVGLAALGMYLRYFLEFCLLNST